MKAELGGLGRGRGGGGGVLTQQWLQFRPRPQELLLMGVVPCGEGGGGGGGRGGGSDWFVLPFPGRSVGLPSRSALAGKLFFFFPSPVFD